MRCLNRTGKNNVIFFASSVLHTTDSPQIFFKIDNLVRIQARGELKVKIFLRLEIGAGELDRRRNPIFKSLLITFEKLKKLGLIYYNGKIFLLGEEVINY